MGKLEGFFGPFRLRESLGLPFGFCPLTRYSKQLALSWDVCGIIMHVIVAPVAIFYRGAYGFPV